MRFRLVPSNDEFFAVFSGAARNMAECVEHLAAAVSDPTTVAAEHQQVKACERKGDEFTRDLLRRLDSTFVTPFDREDIYALTAGLDDVMDFMEEAVDLINLYEIDELPAKVANQIEAIQRCADLTAEAMPGLRSMRDLEEYWIEINRLENDGDKAYRRILAELFSGQYDALTVLKLKDVVDAFEGAIDAFEKVANTVEQIAVKES